MPAVHYQSVKKKEEGKKVSQAIKMQILERDRVAGGGVESKDF